MKILLECKRLLSYGGLGTEKYMDIGGKRVPRIISRFIIISGLLLLTVIHSIKIYNRYPLGLQALLFPVHCILLNNMKLAVYCILLWKIDQIAQLFDYLEMMVKWRCSLFTASQTIYAKRDSYDKQIVWGIAAIISFLFVLGYTPPVLCWLSTLIFGVPGVKYWTIPIGTDEAVPIDTRQPVSFGIALFAEWFFIEVFLVISILFLIFYVGVCTYVRPCIDDLVANIEQHSDTVVERISIKWELVQFIELHKHLYEMLEMFQRIISVSMFLQLPVFGLVLAILLYQMEHNITDLSLDLAVSITELIYYAIENYVMSYFVSSIINDTGSIGDIAYNSPWYQMPRTERICVEMIIRRSQRPFEVKGLGIFVCSLETFLKLIRSAISYYMIFRRLNTA